MSNVEYYKVFLRIHKVFLLVPKVFLRKRP